MELTLLSLNGNCLALASGFFWFHRRFSRQYLSVIRELLIALLSPNRSPVFPVFLTLSLPIAETPPYSFLSGCQKFQALMKSVLFQITIAKCIDRAAQRAKNFNPVLRFLPAKSMKYMQDFSGAATLLCCQCILIAKTECDLLLA